MSPQTEKRISKFLSLVLRHQPETIGIELDSAGWTEVDKLLVQASKNRRAFTRLDLEQVVRNNAKQRFSFSLDGLFIRANQGHSVPVDLGLVPIEPPEHLFHGTVDRFFPEIKAKGLLKMKRHAVHLSKDLPTAIQVGNRRGEAHILTIGAAKMHEAGHLFYCSANGVWLTEIVPPQFITFP